MFQLKLNNLLLSRRFYFYLIKYKRIILATLALVFLLTVFFNLKASNKENELELIVFNKEQLQMMNKIDGLADFPATVDIQGGEYNNRNFELDKNSKMLNYFSNLNGDASLVTWSHAVNSKEKLVESLQRDYKFLEADILLIDDKHAEPIMAHPPFTSSDITFKEWLNMSKSSGKGLKLDFKTPNAVLPCLIELENLKYELRNPIILNADVFRGKNAIPVSIDPKNFINDSLKYYPSGVLSLGWTTDNKTSANYSWSDVYEAYSLLTSLKLVNSNTGITFAVRALWSTKSLMRLLWLQIFTKGTLTIWSHDTDQLSSFDSLLLFRKFFPKDSVYYDLPEAQDKFFRKYAYDQNAMNNMLNESKDKLVKNYLKNNFSPDSWSSLHGTIFQCDHAALMINNGASFITTKEYKAKDGFIIYEVTGKFEIFSIVNKKTNNDNLKSNQNPNGNTTSTSTSNDNDNNIEVANPSVDNNVACVRISLRTNSIVDIYDDLKDYQANHSPGSINIYLYTNGVVKIFIGNKLEQEAILQASNFFEYSITDVGVSNQVHIDLNSYDSEMNKYSLQFLIKANYEENQRFFITQTLLTDFFAVGCDILRISDEISDPQDRDSVENQQV